MTSFAQGDFFCSILFNCLLSCKLFVPHYGKEMKTGFLSGPYTGDTTSNPFLFITVFTHFTTNLSG